MAFLQVKNVLLNLDNVEKVTVDPIDGSVIFQFDHTSFQDLGRFTVDGTVQPDDAAAVKAVLFGADDFIGITVDPSAPAPSTPTPAPKEPLATMVVGRPK